MASVEHEHIPYGAVCRSVSGKPARSLGDGRCLYISDASGDLVVGIACPVTGGEEQAALPNDTALAAAKNGAL